MMVYSNNWIYLLQCCYKLGEDGSAELNNLSFVDDKLQSVHEQTSGNKTLVTSCLATNYAY
jgi:hypothetical protein